jgi:hypothetical protein
MLKHRKRKLDQLSDAKRVSLSLNKTCIFCHLFKTNEPSRAQNCGPRAKVSPVSVPIQALKLTANPHLVGMDHSYCKQPKQVILANEGTNDKENYLNENETSLSGKTGHPFKFNTGSLLTGICQLDFDDLLLDKLVNERLNRLYDASNGNGFFNATKKKKQYKTLFDDDFELDLKQQADTHLLVDIGIYPSPSDCKKLPDLSYEE